MHPPRRPPRAPPLSRRRLLALGAGGLVAPAAGLGLGALPLARPARASVSAADRRFLFLFAKGGWDTTWALSPMFDSPYVDTPTGGERALAGDLPYVAHADTPAVTDFFERHGHRTCLVHGLEVRSVAHDLCTRLVLTNGSTGVSDDWGAILAGEAARPGPMPLLHLSGPSFSRRYAEAVVRVGSQGQLAALLDGSALDRSDPPIAAPPADVAARVAARSRARADAFAAGGATGRGAAIAAAAAAAERGLEDLADAAPALAASAEATALLDRLVMPVAALEAGLCRVAMLSYESWNGVFNGWDSHTDNGIQAPHWNELMEGLGWLLDTLATRPGPAGGSLLDETTVVVLSEMNRFPLRNGDGGKDHWTYGSAMLLGSGVAGGRAIGAYDPHLVGQAVDLASGAVHAAGEHLLPGHLGATLLALGDVDPGTQVEGAAPITAAMA